MSRIEECLEDTDYSVKTLTEPAVANYFNRNKPPVRASNGEIVVRRADIEIQHDKKEKPAILIDVTMTSPVGVASVKRKYSRVGCKATENERRKYNEYKNEFDIDDTSTAYIFFFGMENMGAIGAEAQRFCLLLAKMAGGYIGKKITYIYQRLSVLLQGLRSYHIYSILASDCRDTGREAVVRNRITNPTRPGGVAV